MKISLCMIVRNEEEVLARCLDSVCDIADEIIVVDTGSTDRTKSVAAKFGAAIYDFEWVDDFSAARNFSFSHATGDFILWLDADDVVSPRAREKLRELKDELHPGIDIVMCPYAVAFDSADNPTFVYYRERLINRNANLHWVDPVHECIPLDGVIVYRDVVIEHRKVKPSAPARNLKIYRKLIKSGALLSPRQQYYYGRELYYNEKFKSAKKVLTEFLDGKGWVENMIDACAILARCERELGDEERAVQALFRSFTYDRPRAEICCDIGEHFMRKCEWAQAIFWYEIALRCPRTEKSGAFVSTDCYEYIPYLQLCLCQYRLGNVDLAKYYNELAGEIKPESPAVLSNRIFFEKM